MIRTASLLVGLFMLLAPWAVQSQSSLPFEIMLEEITYPNWPGVQSFAGGHYNGKFIIIGGRIQGLHRRMPTQAFSEAGNNKDVWVLDPATGQVWSTSLSVLPTNMYEQLQSTNLEFEQVGNTLYIIGGYGWSATIKEFLTYPYLTAVDLPTLVNAVMSGGNIEPAFRQIEDSRLAVTGGYLDKLNNTFVLAGGQYFEGRYNPMGPNSGPGFFQEYTNAIKRFDIVDDGINLSIANYVETVDANALHRRDYIMAPQVFPGGQPGLTMFSGVFQYNANLPWLNCVDITSTSYQERNDFVQNFSHYHGARLPIYDANDQSTHTVFFGGIARYYLDANGNLIDDTNVPFVKTISVVTRDASNALSEQAIGEMPGYLGAGAEFFLADDAPTTIFEDMLDLSALTPGDTVLAGYIYGGIESTQPNIFNINNGTQSSASNRLFKVWIITPVSTDVKDKSLKKAAITLSPNPAAAGESVLMRVDITEKIAQLNADLVSLDGTLIGSLMRKTNLAPGSYTFQLDLPDVATGVYLVRLQEGNTIWAKQIVIHD